MSYLILSLFVSLIVVADTYTQQPIFAFTYDSPKWILLYAFAAIFLAISIFKKKKLVIEYPSFIRIPLFFYSLGIFLALNFAPAGNKETVLLEHLLFMVLTFCFYFVLKEDKKFLQKLSVVSFCGLALMGIAVLITRFYIGRMHLPFFGSPTMYGEYLGALLVVGAFFILCFKNSKKLLIIKTGTFFLASIALFVIQPRAPIMALFIVVAFMLSRKNEFFKIKKSFVLATVTLGLLLLVLISFNSTKMESVSIRKVRWANTLDLILKSPLGSGLGNYAAAYGEFQNSRAFDVEAGERTIIANPHNAYLELAAESGIIAFVAFILLLFFSMRALMREKSHYATLCISLIIYWGVDAFFNYPQDCPASYFFFAFTAGLLFYVCRDSKIELPAITTTILQGLSLLVLVALPYRTFSSELMTFRDMNDLSTLSKACSMDPQNWRACLRSVSLEWGRGNKDKALSLLEALELRFPEHYIIRKKTIQLLFESGNHEKGCEMLREFDKRFNNGSSMHNLLVDKCS